MTRIKKILLTNSNVSNIKFKAKLLNLIKVSEFSTEPLCNTTSVSKVIFSFDSDLK
jgi:hypothetical protein